MPIPASVKVVGLVITGAVLVLGLLAGATYLTSERVLNRRIDVPVEVIAVPTSDITAIQRGQHLASAVATCTACHGPNLAGRVSLDDPALGRIVPPNLTRGLGGVGGTFSNADYARAIRYGVDPTGRLLLSMPSDDYNAFTDADLGAIVAYVRSLPAIDTTLPSNEIRIFGRLLLSIGLLPLQPAASIDRTAPRPRAAQTGVTPEYGAYLVEAAGCPTCHGPGLGGAQPAHAGANAVPAPNITPAGLGSWSDADFVKAMRTGTRPDGRELRTSMPWPYYAQMSDDELHAIWRFLQAIPPRETGSR